MEERWFSFGSRVFRGGTAECLTVTAEFRRVVAGPLTTVEDDFSGGRGESGDDVADQEVRQSSVVVVLVRRSFSPLLPNVPGRSSIESTPLEVKA